MLRFYPLVVFSFELTSCSHELQFEKTELGNTLRYYEKHSPLFLAYLTPRISSDYRERTSVRGVADLKESGDC